ncbi:MULTISPECIES: neutral zinc metallopeptidase [Gluconobacter]|uniref:KPN_02809 family neutral zinc metallopeptidase n=1 Tax=Gluconobacter TaxID=441 RepID=UPI000A397898|nr:MULTISPECIES: neutral zinc metallopeptidase [Gluconobacter]MBS1023571.1 neutral zinc metallopeptidase [Gluconobacter cerinus]MBS1038345.1 neutral zinc metallopeptidase [Gluconobacter cerinus]MBS1044940.1 neutral zinc metallopeptidase [Gluconobacter cerinus]OUJ08036.1 membrane protein [Gluconobacter sp. DsW_058]
MRLDDQRESTNIDDRRGSRGGGRGPLRIGGIGGVILVIGALYFGVDPRVVLSLLENGPTANTPATSQPQAAKDDPGRKFIARILGSTEDVWSSTFQQMGRTYHDPGLVLFSGGTQSGCGYAQTSVGPFYCPADHKVYLDLQFFQELQDRLGASGDFAKAYVVAHEVGHHVQNELGIMQQVNRQGNAAQKGANGLSVRVELQADCFAGVWAKRANDSRRFLETGDIEEGMNAASAVGDDRLERKAQGYVVPDSFTHGTSAQRVAWFKRGLESGDIKRCDTFNAPAL